MKFFLDTANLDELRKGVELGLVDGVTTNPTLIAKEGKPIEEQIRKICEIVNGDISAEVVATDSDGMIREGRKLAAIHKNVVVKVPLTRDGIRACSLMSKDGIRVNVTLCFSAAQAILAAKAGAYFVSPFVGRVDDTGWNIRYIKVDTRNWWPGKRVLISPYSVREIDWSGRLMHISVNRQRVKDSPSYDPRITIDGAYEERFLTYYGIRWVAA